MTRSTLRRIFFVSSLASLALHAGCSSGSTNAATPNPSTDGGASDDGGALSPDMPAPYPRGVVSISASANSYIVNARFEQKESYSCTETVFGDCKVYDCHGDGSNWRTNAGALSVTGGKMPLAVKPTSSDYYDLVGSMPLFAPGDVAHVSAGGANVDAFQLDAQIPGPIAMSAVAQTVPRDQPLTFHWKPPTQGPPGILRVSGHWSSSITFGCSAPAGAGQMTLVPAALAMLPDPSIEIESFHTRTVRAKAGMWTIDLAVGADVTMDGHAAFVQIDLK